VACTKFSLAIGCAKALYNPSEGLYFDGLAPTAQQGILLQFDTAREIEEEDTTDHAPLQALDDIL
jgi:hypothetical protein